MSGRFEAVLFDLDGTLGDTLPDTARLVNRVLDELGLPPQAKQDVERCVGAEQGRVIHGMLPPHSPDDMRARALDLWTMLSPAYGETGAPYEGVEETLACLKHAGIKTAVVSNRSQAQVERYISRCFSSANRPQNVPFDFVLGGSDELPRKPHLAMIPAALSALDVDRARALYVGDTTSDMTAAREAGVTPVFARWGYGNITETAMEACIEQPDDAIQLLGR